MNEIKETLAILKTRWIEASLIIGLGFLPYLLNHIFRIYPDLGILVSFVSMGIFLFVTIVSVGFLRTVYLEQDKRQSLLDLMRIGKHFFWRLFTFGILCGLAMMLFVWLLRTIITDTGTNATFPLAHRIGFTVITLILAKLTLLIPAIIIVLDCSLSKSFGFMWKVKLLKAKPLLIIFLIQIVVLPYLLLFSPNFRGAEPAITWGYTLSMLYSIMLGTLTLMVQVMAVRFVSSLGIDCNEPYKLPESFKLTSIV
ncbi:MAG: hypothetical protein ISS77_01425 [Phycisphaerae bacterium]|nr:hypothetical protein [Phycisphaerae bacterium]